MMFGLAPLFYSNTKKQGSVTGRHHGLMSTLEEEKLQGGCRFVSQVTEKCQEEELRKCLSK